MTLDKLLLQVRRIAEHRELGAEKRIRAAYKQCLKELKQFIGYEYATLAEDGKLTYDILAKKQVQARFLEEVQQRVDAIAPEIRSEMTRLVSSVYNLSYNGMIEAAASSVPGEVSSALKGLSYVQPMQIKSGIDNTLINKIMLNDILEKNRKGVIYDLKQAINIGITNGETVDMVARRISKALDGDYKKSVRVARTEVHRVREAGLNEGARDFDERLKEAGVDMRMAKIWRTMKDNRVRPNVVRKSKKGTITKMGNGANHIQMEGQTVLADEQFELSDGNMTDAPGQSGIAAQDINCRCFVRYKLVSEEEYVQLTGKTFDGKAFTDNENRDIIELSYQDWEKADTALTKEAEDWAPKLNADEKKSITDYTGDDYIDINDWLRKGMAYDDEWLEDTVNNIDNAIDKYELKQSISVIRGTSSQIMRRLDYKLDDSIIGETFRDPAYLSSSVSKDVANGFAEKTTMDIGGDKVFIQFDIPAGKGRGAYINSFNGYDEKEFLIKRDAPFEFYEVTQNDNGILLKARWKE